MNECPLCLCKPTKVVEYQNAKFDCPRCGVFGVSGTLMSTRALGALRPDQRYLLSAITRRATDRHGELRMITNDQSSAGTSFEELLNLDDVPRSHLDKAVCLLSALARATASPGAACDVSFRPLWAARGFLGEPIETDDAFKLLAQKGWIVIESDTIVFVTVDGFAHLQSLMGD